MSCETELELCNNCRLWATPTERDLKQPAPDRRGRCHCRPPVVVSAGSGEVFDGVTYWPRTAPDDWCGKWKPAD